MIDAEVHDGVMVRAKPLEFMIGLVEAVLELLVQGHNVVRLDDRLEFSANKAGVPAPWLEFQAGRGDPRPLLRGARRNQLALHFTNAGREHGALRWIQQLVRPGYPLIECFALKKGKAV
ncbi:hypothetical protein [Bradyrhizobium sp. RP6]|uniref:hypothetical protein n=1 Tax=Bradyrhizobium sp. RP6 TaxID=2489596 RepID=UPI000F52F4AF|nr:hypothetical protein [Bradyrhizobium sp. RP6]RQH13594.1 hypothetical protein EHH60_11845 [Bradyrhizobium sp. RP6]